MRDASPHLLPEVSAASSPPGLGTGIVARVTVTVPALALLPREGSAGARDVIGRGPLAGPAQVAGLAPATVLDPVAELDPGIELAPVAELEGVGPIPVEVAAQLAAEGGTLRRLLTDPVSGVPLALDRRQYRPPPSLAEFIKARDGTCRFPGCDRPAHHCEVDHTVDWQWGGPTNADNLACLCRRHHVLKHESEWQVMQIGDAVLHWTSPTGAARATRPRRPGRIAVARQPL